MGLSPELITGLVAIISALVGALPGVISSFISRRSDDKKYFNELVVKAAAENWRFVAEHSQSRAILPLEHYIIHTAKMCEFAFSGEPITPETTKNRLKEIEEIMNVLANHAHSISSSKNQT